VLVAIKHALNHANVLKVTPVPEFNQLKLNPAANGQSGQTGQHVPTPVGLDNNLEPVYVFVLPPPPLLVQVVGIIAVVMVVMMVRVEVMVGKEMKWEKVRKIVNLHLPLHLPLSL
jgi:hypothetical protein